MTFKEKLKKDYPSMVSNSFYGGGCKGCPYKYGYESEKDMPCKKSPGGVTCEQCWNRQMPIGKTAAKAFEDYLISYAIGQSTLSARDLCTKNTAIKVTTAKNPDIKPTIKRVMFNPPATIIFWSDDTKTVVKCQEGDTYNPETGFALAYLKKLLGNDNTFNKEIDKWVPQFDGVIFDMKQAEKDMYIKQAYNALDLYIRKGANKLTKTQMAGIIEQAVGHLMDALDFPEVKEQ
jgi:hypothetical protein